MKNWKISLITILCFFAVSSMIVFSSCEQDPCMELDCKNDGVCSDGYCQCPVGFEGAECEIASSERFVGTFTGTVKCQTSQGSLPTFMDTVTISLIEAPNKVKLNAAFGNTNIQFVGDAATPEARFSTVIDNDVTVHAYVTVDGDLLYIYLESSDESIEYRQICKFQGIRIN